MQILENSDSIVSDDQCLELDCRIIVPKFKKEEYDTFQTETNTSVISRVMKMKSNSQEFRFKQFNQFSPQGSFNCTQKQIQCSLLNEDEYSNKLKVRLHIQPEEGKLNTKKKKKKDKASQSPASSVEHNNDSQKARKQNQNAIRMQNQLNQPNQQQTIIRSNKRQLSQTFKSYSVEASPLKITRFSQRQIYVTQLVNTYEEPLQEKLSLVQLENNDKLNKGILSRYTSKAKTLKNIVQKTQLKVKEVEEEKMHLKINKIKNQVFSKRLLLILVNYLKTIYTTTLKMFNNSIQQQYDEIEIIFFKSQSKLLYQINFIQMKSLFFYDFTIKNNCCLISNNEIINLRRAQLIQQNQLVFKSQATVKLNLYQNSNQKDTSSQYLVLEFFELKLNGKKKLWKAKLQEFLNLRKTQLHYQRIDNKQLFRIKLIFQRL
ncbi:unnamed protein product [Paramecium sonneborni]|uniref:Uncharacterized protein n=1 Tax=Paramecium sonneborni TaxID=65129 RepID=A0A8S1MMB5_9CILI|nr:unnamed protein product [Paramecium sonneborni]